MDPLVLRKMSSFHPVVFPLALLYRGHDGGSDSFDQRTKHQDCHAGSTSSVGVSQITHWKTCLLGCGINMLPSEL